MSLVSSEIKQKQYLMSKIVDQKTNEIMTKIETESLFVLMNGEAGEESSIHAVDGAVAIVILEPVRNLRWKSLNGDEVTVNCAPGTVFFIPAMNYAIFHWSQSFIFLKVNIKECYNDDRNEEKTSIRISVPPEGIVTFSSKQCLHLGRIIYDNLQDNLPIDEYYLFSLHSVISHLILKNALLFKDMGAPQVGLSNFASRQIETYLKENFRNPVSVPDMAEKLGISSGHFATCFRESFGQTPHQYLLQLRLNEAERFLRETDVPISEIADKLSFSSQSHLTTALKKYRQLTPGEIRRRSPIKRRAKSLSS